MLPIVLAQTFLLNKVETPHFSYLCVVSFVIYNICFFSHIQKFGRRCKWFGWSDLEWQRHYWQYVRKCINWWFNPNQLAIQTAYDYFQQYSLRCSGSSVSEGINNGLSTVNEITQNAVDGLENVKNATLSAIDQLTPRYAFSYAMILKWCTQLKLFCLSFETCLSFNTCSQGEAVANAVKNVLIKVVEDLMTGENLYKSLVQR